MADTNIYYGSGIEVAGNIDIGAIGLSADSRLMVKTRAGLDELKAAKRVYDGMIVYCEADQTYHKCRVVWDNKFNIVSCSWTEVVIKSEEELESLITHATTAAMEFKGATATLPENPARGDMYKVAGENINITIDGVAAKIGDSVVYNGTKWFLIPSGDDDDTWRPINGVNNESTLTFKDGSKLDVTVATDGTITYGHEAITAPKDKTTEGDKPTRTYITTVETDGFGHITGYKTATEKETNTTYEFFGEEESTNVGFIVIDSVTNNPNTVYLDAYSRGEIDKNYAKTSSLKNYATKDAVKSINAWINNVDTGDIVIPSAQHAEAAETATSASKATNDSNGNKIVDTYTTKKELVNQLDNKQDKLISGQNIKTINGVDLLGRGDIALSADGSVMTNADWDQFDETKLDYIKNRTHYTKIVETVYTNNKYSNLTESYYGITEYKNKKVYVIRTNDYNDYYDHGNDPLETNYLLQIAHDNKIVLKTIITKNQESEDPSGWSVIGNSGLMDSGLDNGEYACMFIHEGETQFIFCIDESDLEGFTNETEFVVSLNKFEIKQLDEHYIPNTIARKTEIAELTEGKVDKIVGKGLSTNDFTNIEKDKLAGIEAGAEKNVQPNWNQNDENAPDYVKNRTHYEATILGPSTLSIKDSAEEFTGDSNDYHIYCSMPNEDKYVYDHNDYYVEFWMSKLNTKLDVHSELNVLGISGETYYLESSSTTDIRKEQDKNYTLYYACDYWRSEPDEDGATSARTRISDGVIIAADEPCTVRIYCGYSNPAGYWEGFVEINIPSAGIWISRGITVTLKPTVKYVCHQLDDKFIPDTIARKDEVANTYALNKRYEGTGEKSFIANDTCQATKYYSFSEGMLTTASGDSSHAEGSETIAKGRTSHAEGAGTVANGIAAHAEGGRACANGAASHAEGMDTIANGPRAHVEGYHTIASATDQHVQGKYNIAEKEEDLDKNGYGKYVHIVGNGEDDSKRSNAHTLDWDGNAWYAGQVAASEIKIGNTTFTEEQLIKILGFIDTISMGGN